MDRWVSGWQLHRPSPLLSHGHVCVLCSEAQVFSQKHSHDLGQVLHSGTVHVLLCVVQRVPELWEGGGYDV